MKNKYQKKSASFTLFLFFAAIMIFSFYAAACSDGKKWKTGTKNVAGHIYEGLLPAADCPGVRMTLQLNADKSAAVSVFYLERSGEAETREGTWQFDKEGVVEVWFPIKTPPYYFGIRDDDSIVMLNSGKAEVCGELAGSYVLKKQK